MRSQSGITITALVVAIIVMIILLSVTITVAIKDGGLFQTAKTAINVTAEELDNEQNKLDNGMREYVENTIQGIEEQS